MSRSHRSADAAGLASLGMALTLIALSFAPVLALWPGTTRAQRPDPDSLEENSENLEFPETPSDPEPIRGMGLPGDAIGSQGFAWGELGLLSGGSPSNSATSALLEVGFRLRVSEEVLVDASWGLLMGEVQVGGLFYSADDPDMERPMPYQSSGSRAEVGNPTFRLSVGERIESFRYQIGVGAIVPVAAGSDPTGEASAEQNAAERAAAAFAHHAQLVTTGFLDPWRWLPERAGVFIPARIALELSEIALALDTAVAVLVPILGDANAEIDTLLQAALDMAGIFGGGIRGGMRLSVTGGVSGASIPHAQAALQPYLRVEIEPAFLMLRANLLLTQAPLGVEMGSGIWGLLLSGGGSF